jgi:hypothetical protein
VGSTVIANATLSPALEFWGWRAIPNAACAGCSQLSPSDTLLGSHLTIIAVLIGSANVGGLVRCLTADVRR